MTNPLQLQIRQLKKQITYVSSQLEEFLLYLDQQVFTTMFLFCGFHRRTESRQFMRAFKTLSQNEKMQYYCLALRLSRDISMGLPYQLQNWQNQNLEVSYRINEEKEWKKTVVKMNYEDQIIQCRLFGQNIKLSKYMLRMSRCKERAAFALECHKVSAVQTLRLSVNSKSLFDDLLKKVKYMTDYGIKMMMQQKMGLKQMLNTPMKKKIQKRQSISIQIMNSKQRQSLKQLINNSNRTLDLTSQKYNSISKNLIDQSIINNLDNNSSYQQYGRNVFINLNMNRVKKLFMFQEDRFPKDWVVDQLRLYQNFKIWKMPLFMISLLADIPNQDSRIYHEIDMYKDRSEYDYVYLRHHFVRGKVDYFIDKSISTVEYGSHQTSQSRGKIEFCLWRIKKVGNIVQVLAECQISHIECLDIYDAISSHMGEFQQVKLCQSKKPNLKKIPSQLKSNFSLESATNNNAEFSQYENGLSIQNDRSEFYSICSDQKRQSIKKKGKSQNQSAWQFQTIINDDDQSNSNYFLNNTHPFLKTQSLQFISHKQSPFQPYQIHPLGTKNQYKQFKNGIFFDESEFVVNKNGELVFVNEQKIKAQSSVLKTIVKRIGGNLFSGKSILNMSLPIEIFGNDTNLQRLCKSNAFAPHFLENKVNASPIDKMKAVIAASIGNILLYIDMAKPFNPILGETYQGFIDACPLYGEQISHHPPISSIFMAGRGYFISANLEAKVNFGLNSVAGLNQGVYKVAFDHHDPTKNVIQFTTPPGQLSGTVYGQRKLTLSNQSHYFDQANQLYCMIQWGKKKNKHELSYFNDYCQGSIVKLSKQHHDIVGIKVKKEDQILGFVSGRWSDKIYFKDEVLLSVNDTRPYLVLDEVRALESDGRYRKDLQLLSIGKHQLAHLAKQELQQLQRKDRSLRKQHSK